MLSLTPRFDLFRFLLPPEFIPTEIKHKYNELINSEAQVITSAIDYLNESIKTITIPGMTDLIQLQRQISKNTGILPQSTGEGLGKLGRINTEPVSEISYYSSNNPLDKIDKTFALTFRLNQGLYNYFMIHEIIMYKYSKDINYGNDASGIMDCNLQILGENGKVTTNIIFKDCHIDGIEGLEFSYDKVERNSETFQCNFKFSNITYDFLSSTK